MRFTEPQTPFIGAGPSSRYVTVQEGDVRAIKPDGIHLPSLLIGSVIFIIGFVVATWSITTIVTNKQLQLSDDPCPGHWGDTHALGDGSLYCSAENWSYGEDYNIEKIETAENHFRITYDDWTTEYRWESIDHKSGLVVIGEMYEDGYMGCSFYFAENELPEDYGTNALYLGDNSYALLPSWCDRYTSSTDDIEYSSDEPHPFLGVMMYSPMWSGHDLELVFELTTNETMERGYYPSSDMVENAIEEEIIIATLLVFVALYIFLRCDHRRFVLKFDVQGKRMSLRRSMTSTRWGGWSWQNVNYSSASLIRERNSVSLMMKIKGEKRLIAQFYGEQADEYVEPLKALLEIPGRRVTYAHLYDGLPTLDMFDVSNWDSDEDAKHIYEFYLEESGSTNDAKTIEEVYQGAGIQSLSDQVDAQKLLNHVIELLDPEFEAPEIIVNQTRVVEYTSPPQETETDSAPESTSEPPNSVQLDAFWSQDDSDGN